MLLLGGSPCAVSVHLHTTTGEDYPDIYWNRFKYYICLKYAKRSFASRRT